MQLKNKVALVTGAARGIGKAIATRFAAEGASVVISDVDMDEAARTAAAMTGGGAAAPFNLDVTDPAQVTAAVDFARERFGRLDILVNNAGVTTKARVLDLTLDAWERILRINLTGTMLCSQAAARVMVAGGGGRIINIAYHDRRAFRSKPRRDGLADAACSASDERDFFVQAHCMLLSDPCRRCWVNLPVACC